jgi:hypothetical protein
VEVGRWYLVLQEAAALGKTVKLAVRRLRAPAADGSETTLPIMAVLHAGVQVFTIASDAPPPPYAVLGVGSAGGREAIRFQDGALVPLDGEMHLRDVWRNSSNRVLGEAERQIEQWMQRHATPVTFAQLAPSSCTLHALRRDERVNMKDLFASVAGRCRQVELQDPYLRTRHQLGCVERLLQALAGSAQAAAGASHVMFRLRTRLSDPAPREDAIPARHHRRSFEDLFARHRQFDLDLRLEGPRSRLHMRYLKVSLVEGGERFYVLERGLDIEDERTGTVRADTFVLEFAEVPAELRPMFDS